jgi:hypothetical protein
VTAEPFSPELALVCPELRAAAIAALPERDPDAWLDRRQPGDASPVYDLMAALGLVEPALHEQKPTPLPAALLAYTAMSATRFALEAAAFMGVVLGLLSIVAFVHS